MDVAKVWVETSKNRRGESIHCIEVGVVLGCERKFDDWDVHRFARERFGVACGWLDLVGVVHRGVGFGDDVGVMRAVEIRAVEERISSIACCVGLNCVDGSLGEEPGARLLDVDRGAPS